MNHMESSKISQIRHLLIKITPYLGLIAVFVFFVAVTQGRILAKSNMSALINNAFLVMLAAVGAVFVYSYGGIDLSLGALQGVCIVLSCLILRADMNYIWLALLICVVFGAFSGLITGRISGVLGVPPFIASLAVSYVLRGISNTIILRNTVTFPTEYASYDNWTVKIIILLAAIVICFFLFKYTKLGRIQKAIGGNRNTVDFTGINSKKFIILSHVVLGICVGLGAFLVTPRYSIVTAAVGQGFEMDVLIAILLGGMSVTGGAKSKFSAPIIGSLIITILNNGFALWGVSSSTIQITKGLVFIVVVILNVKQGFIGIKINNKRRKVNV